MRFYHVVGRGRERDYVAGLFYRNTRRAAIACAMARYLKQQKSIGWEEKVNDFQWEATFVRRQK